MELVKKNGGNPNDVSQMITKILMGAGHASHMEHSMCASIGILDEKKLLIINEELERNFENALMKWPPLGGLGGFLLKGGKYLEAFGTLKKDKEGLWNCLETLRKLDHGKIKVIKELGDKVIEILVDHYSKILLDDLK